MSKYLKNKKNIDMRKSNFSHRFKWKILTTVLSICITFATIAASVLPVIAASAPEQESINSLSVSNAQARAVNTATIPIDFYVYDTNTSEWKLVATETAGRKPDDSSYRDYITVSDLVRILGSHGFTDTPVNSADVSRQIAYSVNRGGTGLWFSNTSLNTEVPADLGENVVPLSLDCSGYSIALLPGNKSTFSDVDKSLLSLYILSERTNSKNSGIRMHLFNYGTGINDVAQNHLEFYGSSSSTIDAGGSAISDAPKMNKTLKENEYPVGDLKGNTIDMAYLFSPDSQYDTSGYTYDDYIANRGNYSGTTKATASPYTRFQVPITDDGGLFYKDSHDYFIYDSAVNAASYNGKDGFTLYNHAIAPKHIYDSSGYNMPHHRGNYLPFNDATAFNQAVLTSYENKPQLGYPSTDTTVIDRYLSENSDMWFGMTMDLDFYMSSGGLSADKSAMTFDFYGDDDVWVYIDGVLVLDIGGCHGAKSGSINFATGEVNNPNLGGSVTGNNLKAIFQNALGSAFDESEFNGNTFKDFSQHTMRFFYMERGGNISYCRIKFNLPTLPNDSITISKQLDFTDSDMTEAQKTYAIENFTYRFRAVGRVENSDTITPILTPNRFLYLLDESGKPIEKTADMPDSVPTVDGTGGTKYLITLMDDNGWFELKHGQRVMFDNMIDKCNAANADHYHLQEAIPLEYSNAEVYDVQYYDKDGQPVDIKLSETSTDTTYRYYDTGHMTPGNSNQIVFNNKFKGSNLSKIRIAKKLADGSDTTGIENEKFSIKVTVEGKPAADANFFIVDENNIVQTGEANTRTADANGIVQIQTDEILEMEGSFIAGTKYTVSEIDSNESKWNLLKYENKHTDRDGNPKEIVTGSITELPLGVEGVLPANTIALTTFINSSYDLGISVPISKQFVGYNAADSITRTATFHAYRVTDETGLVTQTKPGDIVTTDVVLSCIGDEVKEGTVILGISREDIIENTIPPEGISLYFRIVEDSVSVGANETVINDPHYYVAEVTVTQENNILKGDIKALYRNKYYNEILETETLTLPATAAFVNTLGTYALPETGGAGTLSYIFSGLVIIAISSILMYKNRIISRRRRN